MCQLRPTLYRALIFEISCCLRSQLTPKIKSKFPINASAEAKNYHIVSHIQDYGNVHLIFPFKYPILTMFQFC